MFDEIDLAAPQDSRSRDGAMDQRHQGETCRQLAAYHMVHGAAQSADEMSKLALWLDPDSPKNWQMRAHVLARLGRPEDALRLLSQGKRQGKARISFKDLVVIGLAFAKIGRFDGARKILSRASAG